MAEVNQETLDTLLAFGIPPEAGVACLKVALFPTFESGVNPKADQQFSLIRPVTMTLEELQSTTGVVIMKG